MAPTDFFARWHCRDLGVGDMSEINELKQISRRDYSIRRILRKILLSISRYSLAPSKIRIFLLYAAGIKFSLPQTVFVGGDVFFDDTHPEKISIGRFVRITAGAKIITHFIDTSFEGSESEPFLFYDGNVEIGDFVFIGMNCVIANSVTIGPWAIIGANTVVTKDIPSGAIFAGNPGRIIGYRVGFER
ncbi:MAG: transferase [Deltaproteobacteria bacterium CG_4_8_14_3_um_filter_51_11]|nr:MAG: transferase [Deltaproteobacteria bacterium CG_4_8_14_3_um_filter_51_11]